MNNKKSYRKSSKIKEIEVKNLAGVEVAPNRIRNADMDINKSVEKENEIAWRRNIIDSINSIYSNYLSCRTREELALLCLNVAQNVTQSSISFLGEVGTDNILHDTAINEMGRKLCRINDKKGHKKPPGIYKIRGLYGKILKEGKTLLTNNPSSHPEGVGIPKGHVSIKSFLGVPLIYEGKTTGILALANKKEGYNENDVLMMEALSPVIAEVLRYKDIEDNLIQTRNDLQLAQEVSRTGNWRLDSRKDILYWSRETYDIFGISPNTPLTYERFLESVHPDDRKYVDSKWKETLKGKPYDIEHRIIVDGKIKWIREKAELEYDDHGLKGGFGIAQDITEIKEAQKNISSLAKFPSENPNPVFRIDDRLNVIYSNKPGIRLLRKIGLKSNKILKPLADKLDLSIKKSKDGPSTIEVDIDKSTYEFSVNPVSEGGYFNIYGKDVTEAKKAQRSKLKLLHSRIQSVERRKLAGELHDTVTQTLFSSNLLSETILRLYEKDPEKALEKLKKVRSLNYAALLETRILLYELMPQKIAQESLVDLIKRLAEAINLKSDTRSRFDMKVKGDYNLGYKVKHNFYRVAQEAINNIVKHSKASRVKIELELMPRKSKLIISDNGVGFDIKDRLSKKGFGLNLMNKRAKAIGASLEIISSPGKGTKIKLIGK